MLLEPTIASHPSLPGHMLRSLEEVAGALLVYGVSLELVLPDGRSSRLHPGRGSLGRPVEPLTAQEQRVAMMVASGSTNREIADHLCVTDKTIECHLTHVYRKLDVRSRTELARYILMHQRQAEAA
jgi:DNA-binding NarL/FixJ family response regulator